MFVIFIGPPGSGKGTQAKIVAKNLHFYHLSTGDLLRAFLKKGQERTQELQNSMITGGLLLDDLVNQVICSELQQRAGYKGYILDGYPRNIGQLNFLEANYQEDYIAFYFGVSEEIAVNRIISRYNCSNCSAVYNKHFNNPKSSGCDYCGSEEFTYRADDNLDSVTKRLEEYFTTTRPVIEYYEKRGILKKIDGAQDIRAITVQIENLCLSELEHLENKKK